MPRKYIYPRKRAKSARSRRQRRYRRKFSKANKGTKIGLQVGFPKTMKFKHKYVENLTPVTIPLGAFTQLAWSCNGMFDPNISGAGHQPYYFDQLTPLYDHYTVIGSKIKVSVIDYDSVDNTRGMFTGVVVTDVNSPLTSYLQAMEYSNQKGRGNYKLMNTGRSLRPATFTANWSAKKYFGGSPLSDSELQGTSTANPTEQSFYTVWFQISDGVADSQLSVFVEIEYIAVWTELRSVTSS